jgi:excisionase family DNA binding protein
MTQQTTIGDAARQLGVSPDTIRRRIRQGQLPASKQRTSKGLIWLVDVPDEARGPTAEAGRENELLRDEVGHWRELVATLVQELAARGREVRQLLALLERTYDRFPPSPEPEPARVRGIDGHEALTGRSPQTPPAR